MLHIMHVLILNKNTVQKKVMNLHIRLHGNKKMRKVMRTQTGEYVRLCLILFISVGSTSQYGP